MQWKLGTNRLAILCEIMYNMYGDCAMFHKLIADMRLMQERTAMQLPVPKGALSLSRPSVRLALPTRTELCRNWIMHQTWHDLLFAHWPLPPELLRPLVPEPLELDLYGGQAWLGIVAFRLSGVRLRWLPEIPLVSHFPEINVRTYVRYGDRQGVYFLSLDTDIPLATAHARRWFTLIYIQSRITALRHEGGIRFVSYRKVSGRQYPFFSTNYRPSGTTFSAPPGSLPHWLTERYSFYAVDRRARPLRCDVSHHPWLL